MALDVCFAIALEDLDLVDLGEEEAPAWPAGLLDVFIGVDPKTERRNVEVTSFVDISASAS